MGSTSSTLATRASLDFEAIWGGFAGVFARSSAKAWNLLSGVEEGAGVEVLLVVGEVHVGCGLLDGEVGNQTRGYWVGIWLVEVIILMGDVGDGETTWVVDGVVVGEATFAGVAAPKAGDVAT